MHGIYSRIAESIEKALAFSQCQALVYRRQCHKTRQNRWIHREPQVLPKANCSFAKQSVTVCLYYTRNLLVLSNLFKQKKPDM